MIDRRWNPNTLPDAIGWNNIPDNIKDRINRANRENGFTDRQADHAAIACGYHPGSIWPDWFDAALTVGDEYFLYGHKEDGETVASPGWRQAWLWEETADDSALV